MVDRPSLPTSGYRLVRVYATDLAYQIENEDAPEPPADPSRAIRVAWDWRIVGKRTFDVSLMLEVGASKEHPETARACVVGSFQAGQGALSVGFAQFVREHAPAILLPYVREHISALTSRGPHGTFFLAPINIVRLVKDFDDRDTDGARQLDEDAELAAEFELEFYTDHYPKREREAQQSPIES